MGLGVVSLYTMVGKKLPLHPIVDSWERFVALDWHNLVD